MREPEECDREIARRLAAAFISYQHGIGIEYTLKRYIAEDVGRFWMELAVFVTEAQALAFRDRQQHVTDLIKAMWKKDSDPGVTH